MVYLTIAVLCSVAVSVLLKILRQKNIDIRQTIVAGYSVACLLTWFLLKPDISGVSTLGSAWGVIGALGIMLPAVFIILGRTIEAVGMVATDAAQRLSLIIPIVASFLLFGELITGTHILGLALGFLALAALVYRPQHAEISQHAKRTPLWLFGVWAGYGIIDILFKQVAKQGTTFPLTLFVSFGLAGLLLLIYLLVTRVRWQKMRLRQDCY